MVFSGYSACMQGCSCRNALVLAQFTNRMRSLHARFHNAFRIQAVNSGCGCLNMLLRRPRGVSAEYLDNYL